MHLPRTWKQQIARGMQLPGLQRLLRWVVYLIVPRHLMGVNVVVMNAQGQVLLLKHVFHPYAPWGLPGGWLNRHEDPQVCALRELREETGLTAVLDRILVLQREPLPSQIGVVYLAFLPAEPFSEAEPPLQLSSEIVEAQWFHPQALPAPLTETTQKAIMLATAVAYI